MKRDNWKLGNGIKAGDDALVETTAGLRECHIKKVRGWGPLDEEGNVLIEVDGEEMWVLGGVLKPLPV